MSGAALSGTWTTDCRTISVLGFAGGRSCVRRTVMVMGSQMGKSWGIPAVCGMRYDTLNFRAH